MKLNAIRFLKKQLRKKQYKDCKKEFLLSAEDTIQKKGEFISKEIFNGGPVHKFSLIGRLYLITLLKIGLTPEAKVLDIGCGALRGGYWLIHFLNPGNYYGIEPNQEMVEVGKRILFSKEILDYKSPAFDHNFDFNLSVFNVKFDFMIARSIWTHTSKAQICKILDEFNINTTQKGVLLASYLKPFFENQEYKGSKWVGKSHDSNTEGIVFHSFSWIKSECEVRNLTAKELTFDYVAQIWIHISK